MLLPSHLVISILQLYICLPYESLQLDSCVKLQELAAKHVNIILTRYSKKFHKISAIICNLIKNILFKKLIFFLFINFNF